MSKDTLFKNYLQGLRRNCLQGVKLAKLRWCLKIEGYSHLFIEQSTLIGSGYYKNNSKSILNLRMISGEGIWWTFRWHQQELNAWCEESSWRNWIEDKIHFFTLHEVDRHFLQLVGEWSLLPVSDEMKLADISLKEITGQSSLLPCWSPVLTLNQVDKKFEIYLIDWPADALRWLIKGWTPLAETIGSSKPLLRCPVTIGRMTIHLRMLKQFVLGAVIIIQTDNHLNAGNYWMLAAEINIKLVRSNEEYTVSEITTEEQNDIIDANPVLTSLDDINVSIAFEIGSILMSFAELAALKPGSIIKSELSTATTVNIRVNGRVFATGDFILLDNVPGVRVNKLLQG